MRFRLTANFCACLILLSCIRANAQDVVADTILSKQLSSAIQIYHQAVYPENALYNGAEYLPNNVLYAEGQPYFLTNKPSSGSVMYKGILYENLRLMYDLTRQQLVVIHPLNVQRIKLHTGDISRFTILDHRFVNLQPGEQTTQNVPAGFYELLHEGNVTKLLKRNSKNIEEELSSGSGVLYFIKESNNYYIENAGRYFPLSNRRSVLRAFSDRKKEMTQFLKTHTISPRVDNEATYKLIVAHYDKLTTARTPASTN
jgi:hypothetical protein